MDGYRNHRQERILTLFREIGQLASGAFGLLHIHDDEDPAAGNDWICLTMVRGDIRADVEPRLSPHIPTLEDD